MSTEYGWAADNVVEFEVVLANGDIVKATNSTNRDLFDSLKGGGGIFGIVTAYTAYARPVGYTTYSYYVFYIKINVFNRSGMGWRSHVYGRQHKGDPVRDSRFH